MVTHQGVSYLSVRLEQHSEAIERGGFSNGPYISFIAHPDRARYYLTDFKDLSR